MSKALTSPGRILILDQGQGFGGTVVVAATLMHHLDSHHFLVTLVSAADADFLAMRTEGTSNVVRLAPKYTYVQAGKVREAFQRVPVIGRLLNFVGSKLLSLTNLSYLISLARIMRRERIMLVHCNNYANLDGLLMAWLFGVPCLLHAHGFPEESGPISGWLLRRLRPRVVAISRVVRESVVASGVPANAVRVLHNPISRPAPSTMSAHEFRRAQGIPDDVVLVGIVGRVVGWKGQLEFVAACIHAMERGSSLHAVIVGDAADYDDSYYRAVYERATQSGYDDRIHFAGFVADTSAVYGALDILVHASIEPEPFGLVITEAMAHGTAVIAANTGSSPELITHGVTGFLENPRDTAALAERITALAQDTALRQQIAKAGKAHASTAFDPIRYARDFSVVYDRALDGTWTDWQE